MFGKPNMVSEMLKSYTWQGWPIWSTSVSWYSPPLMDVGGLTVVDCCVIFLWAVVVVNRLSVVDCGQTAVDRLLWTDCSGQAAGQAAVDRLLWTGCWTDSCGQAAVDRLLWTDWCEWAAGDRLWTIQWDGYTFRQGARPSTRPGGVGQLVIHSAKKPRNPTLNRSSFISLGVADH